MDLKVTRWEVDDGVGLLTLDRPERLNAWTLRMGAEYRHLLREADADPEVRVVVVTGAGRGFCAGADLKALDKMVESNRQGEASTTDADLGHFAAPAVDRHPALDGAFTAKPLLAAVNGPVAGVGFVLACFCDIRFAAAGAKLTTSFARLGLPAEHAVSWVLPRLVGPARAADLLFSSRVVLAEEAAELGLVNRVLPPDEMLAATLAYARAMAAECSPLSLATMKAQLRADLHGSLDAAAERSLALIKEMTAGPDFAEGVAAFTAKRPPAFPGLSR